MTPLVLVGIGKIARDQHIPALKASGDFEMVAAVSRNATVEGVRNFAGLDEALDALDGRHAVSLCTPPDARTEMVIAALAAGHDVMVEKPPAASLGEVRAMEAAAERAGRTLFFSWHSRRAPGVAPAKAWLAEREVHAATITWHESVRQWHPGQDWVFEPGGFGVFDPGINALSILTEILPGPHLVETAEMTVPEGRATPIAAELALRSGGVPVALSLDWLAEGPPLWRIEVETDGGTLRLDEGGGALSVDGETREVQGLDEYPGLYVDFAALLRQGRSGPQARQSKNGVRAQGSAHL